MFLVLNLLPPSFQNLPSDTRMVTEFHSLYNTYTVTVSSTHNPSKPYSRLKKSRNLPPLLLAAISRTRTRTTRPHASRWVGTGGDINSRKRSPSFQTLPRMAVKPRLAGQVRGKLIEYLNYNRIQMFKTITDLPPVFCSAPMSSVYPVLAPNPDHFQIVCQ